MLYRRLGRTDLQVSLLGLGSGGQDPFGQKAGVPEAAIHKLIHRALDLGVNLFDTARGYLDSELILGRALKEVPRDRYVVMTKLAVVLDEKGTMASPEQISLSVEESLERMQISEIDVLLVGGALLGKHHDIFANESLPVLEKLQRQGKFRFLRATEWSAVDGAHEWLESSLGDGWFDVAMVARNLINQSAERVVFPTCQEKDLGVVNIFTVRNVFSQPDRLEEVIADMKKRGVLAEDSCPDENPLGWLLEGEVDSLPAAAYKFAAADQVVSSVLTGTIDADELEENVRTVLGPPLSQDKLERIRGLFGHIDEAVGN